MAITRHFKGSTDSYGYGYFGYIEDGQLVLGENWPREGGVTYRGPYEHAGRALEELMTKAPKLYNSITKYYAEEAEKVKVSDAPAKEETITKQFKDSRDLHGNGYFGYIENGELVICHEAPREGGVLYRGSYKNATKILEEVKRCDRVLYNDIDKYFTIHDPDMFDDLKKKLGFDEETKTILFKVKLFMDNHEVHNVLVRGRFQADVIKKLMPPVSEVLTLQTYSGDVFAVRSGKISAVEFLGD